MAGGPNPFKRQFLLFLNWNHADIFFYYFVPESSTMWNEFLLVCVCLFNSSKMVSFFRYIS